MCWPARPGRRPGTIAGCVRLPGGRPEGLRSRPVAGGGSAAGRRAAQGREAGDGSGHHPGPARGGRELPRSPPQARPRDGSISIVVRGADSIPDVRTLYRLTLETMRPHAVRHAHGGCSKRRGTSYVRWGWRDSSSSSGSKSGSLAHHRPDGDGYRGYHLGQVSEGDEGLMHSKSKSGAQGRRLQGYSCRPPPQRDHEAEGQPEWVAALMGRGWRAVPLGDTDAPRSVYQWLAVTRQRAGRPVALRVPVVRVASMPCSPGIIPGEIDLVSDVPRDALTGA